MAHDRFDERHSFNVLGFIQLLYDTTCVNSDFWVKPVWGLGCDAKIIRFLAQGSRGASGLLDRGHLTRVKTTEDAGHSWK